MPEIYHPSLRFLSFFLLFAAFSLSRPAPSSSTTTLQHTPPQSVNSGSRVFLSVAAGDTEQIETVRVYFKSVKEKNYFFITLRNDVRSQYIGRLPSATPDCGKLEYLFLIRNRKGQFIISQKYTIPVIDSRIIFTPPADKIHIYSEMSGLNATIPGFSDNFTLTVVPPSLQFGRMAGLYSAGQRPAETGVAKTIEAVPPHGISNTTLVAAGATVFAISIGGVAISYGSNSSDREEKNTVIDEQKKMTCPFTGTWSGTMEIPPCGTAFATDLFWQGTVDKNCGFKTADKKIHGFIEPATGKISLQLSPELQTCRASIYHAGSPDGQGIFAGNSSRGVLYLNGKKGHWSGRRQ